MILSNSVRSLETIGAGVLARATTPNHTGVFMVGKPLSTSVGTFGAKRLRWPVVTASARNWPDWTRGSAADVAVNAMPIRPAMRSVISGAAPWYGT